MAPQDRALKTLVEAAKAGDRAAFGALYALFQPRVYRFLWWEVGRDQHLTEDLCGETWTRALTGICRFTWQGAGFAPWVLAIARNVWRDYCRAVARRPAQVPLVDVCVELVDGEAGPCDVVLRREEHREVAEAFAPLPEAYRAVLALRFLLGLPCADTAAVLGRSPGAVRALQARAVRALAATLPRETTDPPPRGRGVRLALLRERVGLLVPQMA